MRRCRFHVIMPTVPGISAGISKLFQRFVTTSLAGLSVGLSIWRSIKCGTIDTP